jgi:IS605 OrfB family transposase
MKIFLFYQQDFLPVIPNIIIVRTCNIKLKFQSEQDKQNLHEVLALERDMYNFISPIIFQKRITDSKIIHDLSYHQCRKHFKNSLSQLVIRAQHDVIASYRTAKSNKIKWEDMKEPFTKKRLSMRLDKRICQSTTTSVRICSLNKRQWINCSYILYDRVIEMFKKYSYCDPLVFEKEGEYYLSVTFDNPQPQVDGTSIMGIDVGENRFITTSQGLCLAGKDLAYLKRKTRFLKRILQSKKYKSHSARKKLKRNKKTEKYATKDYVHRVANKILRSTSADVIVLEDLGKIKQKREGTYRNRKRNQYPWGLLKEILIYKALLVSKRVATVNPAFTSQNDYRGIEKGERKGCRYYASDGVILDADWNAAINIGKRYSKISGLPLLYKEPIDGCLYYRGRLSQEPIVSH